MKNKLIIFIKLFFAAFLAFLWLVFIQAEYEIITKPELRNDFPIIKGVGALWVFGLFLLIMAVIIILLLRSVKKQLKQGKKTSALNKN